VARQLAALEHATLIPPDEQDIADHALVGPASGRPSAIKALRSRHPNLYTARTEFARSPSKSSATRRPPSAGTATRKASSQVRARRSRPRRPRATFSGWACRNRARRSGSLSGSGTSERAVWAIMSDRPPSDVAILIGGDGERLARRARRSQRSCDPMLVRRDASRPGARQQP
jgi:hypothetical protein